VGGGAWRRGQNGGSGGRELASTPASPDRERLFTEASKVWTIGRAFDVECNNFSR